MEGKIDRAPVRGGLTRNDALAGEFDTGVRTGRISVGSGQPTKFRLDEEAKVSCGLKRSRALGAMEVRHNLGAKGRTFVCRRLRGLKNMVGCSITLDK